MTPEIWLLIKSPLFRKKRNEMRNFLVALVLLGSNFAVAGDIEYTFAVTRISSDGKFVLTDERRGKEFNTEIKCKDAYYSYDEILVKEGNKTWRFPLQAFLKATDVACHQFKGNVVANIDIDDFHFTYDAATLSIKRIVATPKESNKN
jgi:hypothetical protein